MKKKRKAAPNVREIEEQRIREKTARLRALRLAKETADKLDEEANKERPSKSQPH